ncbi:MAG: hypothetical protein KIT31_33165 [Deltaproteobacteria bacterium]|nr:hypothetical protein [Deltaproteobacteria bacterium]
MTTDLRTALVAAFPPAPITRDMIHAADASWARYEDRDVLPLLEGKSWLELAPNILERHEALLIHTGAALYQAILPAYLLRLIEREHATIGAFHVVSQLTRGDNSVARELFDTRVGTMTPAQRDVVRRAITILAQQPLLREVASDALRSW